MRRKLRKILGLVLLVCPAAFPAQAQHDRPFWREIAANKYSVPQHQSADRLADELSTLLASPDPELRDDLAYSILGHWIYMGTLDESTLIRLADTWRTNLRDGLGEMGTNSVLKRSFSALCLASLARREVRKPFMGAERYHKLVAESVSYLKGERDLRGYDATLHWIHATAHTADLLAGLAGSSQLTPEESDAILTAITERLTTAPEVFTQGEQDRLAAAVVALTRRPVFRDAALDAWLALIQAGDKDVWTRTTPIALARYQNHTYLLQALVTRLAFEPDSPRTNGFRQKVLAVLKDRLD